jgi:hypothetical protein
MFDGCKRELMLTDDLVQERVNEVVNEMSR